jgi:presenilin-like A22 family membrane protease
VEKVSEIKEAMLEQWQSMAGMAGMFLTTIFIGMSIQPLYNIDEVRAFGSEGATKSSYIFLELALIGVFTIVIIWLARRGLEAFIKGFIMLSLFFSLFYVVFPYISIIPCLLGACSTNVILPFALLVSAGLMIVLWRYPEWYIVNLVGVLVGAGVITMIGVSFVPVLIILFMILAAIYDHWAVNGSKHMLELADTMIKLKLPILLVAPKEKGYSFLDEKSDIMQAEMLEPNEENWADPAPNVKIPKRAKGRDALFMGLGDVIFPGMLVISTMSFLPTWGTEIHTLFGTIYLAPLIVALGTLIGGLIGYFALMTQVALGKPQAGLPLLNGGSILGYLISGIYAVGLPELWQNITLF